MLPTPEGSDAIMMSPYVLPGSGNLNTYKDDEFILDNLNFILSPQISPTISPDASMNITSSTSHQNKKIKHHRTSPNINNPISQSRRKSLIINSNKSNSDNGNNSNSPNGQYNVNTDLPSIITGSPNKLHSNSIMLSLLELTSPLMNNMVATSIAPSLQEAMPNLSLGGNLVSDATNTHPPASISDSSDKISPITPSSLMKMKRKLPNSPKSGQNESNSNLHHQQQQQQNQQNSQDQSQQMQLSSKDDDSTFIAPTPPTQLNQIRTNVVNTGSASPSSALGRKSIRSNPNASSPLALGPSKSPHSLKPTISPSLKPKLPGVLADEVAEQLAKKSNYRSILEGTAKSLGISYSSDVHSSLESRRTTHKAAEQKRRDSLKQSFDELKKVVPYQSTLNKSNSNSGDVKNNDNKNNINGKSDGSMKNVSKLFLLKRAHDYIVELEQKSKVKDELIQKLNDELDELKG
ncbi:9120_t:CDS:2, partial [Rhizophagus irregularis]